MARKQKSIYDRIENKRSEIRECEEHLKLLNNELNDLFKIKDEEEMQRMLNVIRANNIDIETALELLKSQ